MRHRKTSGTSRKKKNREENVCARVKEERVGPKLCSRAGTAMRWGRNCHKNAREGGARDVAPGGEKQEEYGAILIYKEPLFSICALQEHPQDTWGGGGGGGGGGWVVGTSLREPKDQMLCCHHDLGGAEKTGIGTGRGDKEAPGGKRRE